MQTKICFPPLVEHCHLTPNVSSFQSFQRNFRTPERLEKFAFHGSFGVYIGIQEKACLASQVKVVSLRKLFLPVLLAADKHFSFVCAFLSLIFFAFSYVPNTCVDPPHEMKVVAIQFQPQQKTDGAAGPLAMTAGRDGKFKIWALTEEGKYVQCACNG